MGTAAALPLEDAIGQGGEHRVTDELSLAYTHALRATTGVSMAVKRCTSSREGKALLSCWITEELRMQLDRVWAAKGLRPHGRTQKGMEEMIAAYLAAQQES
jgi:hypothetical protein